LDLQPDGEVDLDLSDLAEAPTPPVDNLIDFDASGLSLEPRDGDPRR
jgi:hypothetical protein